MRKTHIDPVAGGHAHSRRVKALGKLAVLLVVCSLIVAVPIAKLTLPWSKNVSWHLYGDVTRALHLHSPTIVSIDKEGIPVDDDGYQSGQYIGPQRNPLTIATQALSYYDKLKEHGDAKDETYFRNCIEWLENARIDKGTYSLWAYDFALPTYHASAPWYSAMAQARIMVAFERAYELTPDQRYLQLSLAAMRALEVPIEDGGVLHVDPEDGGKWYEEVAGGGSSPSEILNGFIFSLLDLNDFYFKTGSQEAKSLFDDGLAELKRHLPEYDTGRWTYYDRVGHFAYDYHYVHIDQMRALYEITGDAEFDTYRAKWSSYFPINPMWARERFAAYLFDFAMVFVGLGLISVSYKVWRDRMGRKS